MGGIAVRIDAHAEKSQTVHGAGPHHRGALPHPAGEDQRVQAAEGRDHRGDLCT